MRSGSLGCSLFRGWKLISRGPFSVYDVHRYPQGRFSSSFGSAIHYSHASRVGMRAQTLETRSTAPELYQDDTGYGGTEEDHECCVLCFGVFTTFDASHS